MSPPFHDQVSSVGTMNASLVILVIYEYSGFRKKLPIDAVITNFIICVEFDLFIKILNFNVCLEI